MRVILEHKAAAERAQVECFERGNGMNRKVIKWPHFCHVFYWQKKWVHTVGSGPARAQPLTFPTLF